MGSRLASHMDCRSCGMNRSCSCSWRPRVGTCHTQSRRPLACASAPWHEVQTASIARGGVHAARPLGMRACPLLNVSFPGATGTSRSHPGSPCTSGQRSQNRPAAGPIALRQPACPRGLFRLLRHAPWHWTTEQRHGSIASRQPTLRPGNAFSPTGTSTSTSVRLTHSAEVALRRH